MSGRAHQGYIGSFSEHHARDVLLKWRRDSYVEALQSSLLACASACRATAMSM